MRYARTNARSQGLNQWSAKKIGYRMKHRKKKLSTCRSRANSVSAGQKQGCVWCNRYKSAFLISLEFPIKTLTLTCCVFANVSLIKILSFECFSSNIRPLVESRTTFSNLASLSGCPLWSRTYQSYSVINWKVWVKGNLKIESVKFQYFATSEEISCWVWTEAPQCDYV